MSREKILVVDDELDIMELVSYNLRQQGYDVLTAETGEQALLLARCEDVDLVLLDLMLPGVDGLEVCRSLKRDTKTIDIPIIMLTARGEESDVVTGLEMGADDYVTKPFSPKVLMARVAANLRKARAEDDSNTIRRGDLTINIDKYEVRVDGDRVELTRTEYSVLTLLAKRPGRVFTRYQIVDATKGDDYIVTDRAVDVQIVGLRKKLGDYGRLIETVRGVGYRFRED